MQAQRRLPGSGQARLSEASLEDADFGGARFDKVFAFNVNVFWTEPGKGLDRIQSWLAPGGAFSLFYMPPTAEWVSYYGKSPAVSRVSSVPPCR